MKYCFGVDIGGTTVKMGLFQTDGVLLEKWEIPTRTENGGEMILPDVAKSISEVCEKRSLEKDAIEGIGIGVPAPVTEAGIVKNTANLGWGYREVKREMEELTNLKVCMGNDANVAALGEMWLGAGKGEENIVMVTLGTGVGGGVILNGRPLVGTNGAGGEIGHICVNETETKKCGCGNTGCLEQYASATGIARLAAEHLEEEKKDSLLRGQEKVDAKAVFDALKEGDGLAEDVVEEFGRYLGYALANIAVVVDPAVIVIGGGVSKAGEILLSYVEKNYMKRAFFANKEVKFKLAELGNDAGICGAAKLILE
ncbi:MAG: ROK family glucokinase [Lachnospiraceae bacterium]|nr:ROK family glucokinase [Lachnospiraceae bacterium]